MFARLVTAAWIGMLPLPSAAQGVLPGEVFTFLLAEPLAPPQPVLGTDGRTHLAYEVTLANFSRLNITLDRVEAVDPAGASLWSLEGDALAAMTVAQALENGAIPPGGTAVVLFDGSFDAGAALPDSLTAQITSSRRPKGKDGSFSLLSDTASVPAQVTFRVAQTSVGTGPARVPDPPLTGDGWVAINGCCDAPVSHRTGFLAINGTVHASERFAIDWIQLTPEDRLFNNDGSKVEDYPFYGAPVLAVADATVVSIRDGLDPQVPFNRNPNLKPVDITGNSIVLDLGGGTHAAYAHLLKGSITVKPGDRVTSGQQIAQLGNTGNSDGPHLHFQLMDGPSPLYSNGLPHEIRSFTSRGVLRGGADAAFEAAAKGEPVAIDPRLSGAHAEALPLNDQVVGFD